MSRLARILVDCAYIDFSWQPTGIPRVVSQYIAGAVDWARSRGVEVCAVAPAKEGLVRVRPSPPALRRPKSRTREPASAPGADPALIYMNRGARPPAVADAGPGDLLFSPAYWHDVDPELYQTISDAGAKIVTLVHDVLPVSFPACYPSPWNKSFADNLSAVFSYADEIVTVSKYTASVLREFRYRKKLSHVPINVAFNGFEPLKEEADGDETLTHFANPQLHALLEGRPAPFIMVGSIEPKKAHVPVVATFERLWEGGFERDLVIVGRRGWLDDEIVARLQLSPYFGKRLFWFSTLDDVDLASVYEHAHALVFASLGERFGIPMIESAWYGKPVVAHDTMIAREVLGERGTYFDSSATMRQQILKLEDVEAYGKYSKAVESLRWPSWKALLPDFYDALHERHFGSSGEDGLRPAS